MDQPESKKPAGRPVGTAATLINHLREMGFHDLADRVWYVELNREKP